MKEFIKKIIPNSILNTVRDYESIFIKKIDNYEKYIGSVKNFYGLEIGGPSYIFKKEIPIYNSCLNLEFINFSSNTVWEGKISEFTTYFKNKIGRQHIAEASDLSIFTNQQFDFILSSNCLEHLANPIKALKEWKRVTKKNIILVVPRKKYNFDHRRPITSFDHLIDDFKNNIGEDDLSHLEEILLLHDLKLDPPAGSLEEFKNRSLNNFENRCLHHHVFDDNLIKKICDYLDMKIIDQTFTKFDWIFLIKTQNKN